ncbi:hypothetical protein [Sphingorhabdus sp.]|uniref:hypothetical protein n=1 Tax=Sphingorhabdus sp. TaxID=1902408 RepID=UPI003919B67C
MQDKRFPKWRSWAAVALLLFVAAFIAIVWPRAQNEKPAPIVEAPESTPLAPPPPLRLLDRAALIEAAVKAASAYASGRSLDDAVADLAGRRFELVMPLGCAGPLKIDATAGNGWRYDAESGILQVAFPSYLIGLPENFFGDGSEGDAVVGLGKGFWIEREWLRDAVCPKEPKFAAEDLVPDAPSLAIAETGAMQAPRATVRDRSDYRVSKRVSSEQAPDQEGLRIAIVGRLATNRPMPIYCRSADQNKRPICVILARFDRVSVTNATGSEIFGEWQY